MIKQKKRLGITFYTLMGCFLAITLICCLALFWQTWRSNRQTISLFTETYDSLSQKVFDSTNDYLRRFDACADALVQYEGFTSLVPAASADITSPEVRDFHQILNYQFVNCVSASVSVAYVYLKNSDTVIRGHGIWAEEDSWKNGEITDQLGLDETIWKDLCSAGSSLKIQIQKTDQMDFQRLFLAREIYPGAVLIVGLADSTLIQQLRYSYLPAGSQTLLLTDNDQTILAASTDFAADTETETAFLQAQSTMQPETKTTAVSDEIQSLTETTKAAAINMETANQVVAPIAPPSFQQASQMPNGGIYLDGGQEYFYFSSSLFDGKLKEIVLIPDTIHPKYRRQLYLNTAIIFLIWLIVGGGFSWILARWLYRPVEELLHSLPLTLEERRTVTEFSQIGSAFQKLAMRNNTYQKQLESQKEVLGNSLFHLLTKGELSFTPEISTALAQAGFPVNAFAYVLLYIAIATNEQGDEDDVCTAPDPSILREYAFAAKFCALLAEAGLKSYFAPSGDYDYIGMIDCTNQQSPVSVSDGSVITAAICRLPSLLPDDYPLTLSIGVSQSFDSFTQLRQAASQAKRALTQVNLQSENSETDAVFFYQPLKKIRESVTENYPPKTKVETIQEYISQHFDDPDLSAATVAEHFSISVTWLSLLFKKDAQTGFLDYVHSLRIAKAKDLLQNTTLSIQAIAEQTGYISAGTLTRAFKRYEGITPGWYRKNFSVQKPE